MEKKLEEMTSDERSALTKRLLRKGKAADEAWTPRHTEHARWMRFAIGDKDAQWDPVVLQQRNGRTAKQYPIIKAIGNQVINPLVEAPPEICTYPGDGANKSGATWVNGHLRHIQGESQADRIYMATINACIYGGYGTWRVCVGPDDDAPTQEWEVSLEEVDASTVFWDPTAKRPDYSDAKFIRIRNRISAGDIRETYPDARIGQHEDEDMVDVWEHWERTKDAAGQLANVTRYVHLEDGEILEVDTSYRGKYLPFVTITGPSLTIEGETQFFPLTRDLEAVQQEVNWLKSEAVAQIASWPKSQWIAEDGAIDAGDVGRYARSASDPDSILYYKNGHAKPEPIQPPPFPTGYMELAQANMAMARDITGIYPNMGQQTQNGMDQASGKALKHQRAIASVAGAHFIASLRYGMIRTGKILVDLIRRYHNTDKTRVAIGADGQPTLVSFGPTEISGVQNIDLLAGEYGVTISTGATYATQKEELIDRLFELTGRQPAILNLIADWLISQWPIPGTEELTDRLRMGLLPPDIQQMLAAKDSEDPAEQEQQIRLRAYMGQMENSQLKQALQAITEKFGELNEAYQQLKQSKELDAQTKIRTAEISQETALHTTDANNEAKLQVELMRQREIEERTEARTGREIADVGHQAYYGQ